MNKGIAITGSVVLGIYLTGVMYNYITIQKINKNEAGDNVKGTYKVPNIWGSWFTAISDPSKSGKAIKV
jgi:hypothetical protein